MIKKLKKISIVSLILAVPVGLYCLVYFSNVDDYQVASVTEATPAVNPIVANQAKPIVLAENSKPTVEKPVVKKAPVKKKVVKKKVKRKEKLTTTPALFTPETAPHTGR
jgi:hypothetical protein